MKLSAAVTLMGCLALALQGCTTGWTQYVEDYHCQATGRVAQKAEIINQSLPTQTMIGAPSGSLPVVRMQRVFEYRCDNGLIWAYSAPNS